LFIRRHLACAASKIIRPAQQPARFELGNVRYCGGVDCTGMDLGRVEYTLGREAGKVSPLHERMGMERVVGMNSWLAEYDVSVDI
jgi:hypothetical protein